MSNKLYSGFQLFRVINRKIELFRNKKYPINFFPTCWTIEKYNVARQEKIDYLRRQNIKKMFIRNIRRIIRKMQKVMQKVLCLTCKFLEDNNYGIIVDNKRDTLLYLISSYIYTNKTLQILSK
jgi:hypothetical protein